MLLWLRIATGILVTDNREGEPPTTPHGCSEVAPAPDATGPLLCAPLPPSHSCS